MNNKISWKKWGKKGDSHLINRIRWDEKEYSALKRDLDSDWFGYNKYNEQFEKKLSDFTGVKHFNLTNSGSTAIFVALKVLMHEGRIKRGDYVLHPISTFSTSISSAIDLGLIPVFVETKPNTYVIDPEQVKRAIKKYPQIKGAIIPHLLGNIPDIYEIKSALGDRFLIEDSCDTLGSYFDGKHVGAFGDFVAFSFYGSHHISSGGIGGALGTNNPKLNEIAKSIIFWGRDYSKGESFLNRYKYMTIGTNAQMSALQAAFGLTQMDRIKGFIKDRNLQFREMTEIFNKYDFFELPVSHPKANPSWFSYPLQVKGSAPFRREGFVNFLSDQKVEIRPIMCGNILEQECYHKASHITLDNSFPIADKIGNLGLFIPCWGMPKNQKKDYYMILKKFLQKYS